MAHSIHSLEDIEKLWQEINTLPHKSDRKTLTPLLKKVMEHRLAFYRYGMTNQLQDELSDLLYKALLLELDREEEDSIETAELAYIGISHALNQEISFERYKRRLLLLHYFADYFTDAIVEIFLKQYREEQMLEARNLALDCIQKMQLADMLSMERAFPELIEQDEQVCEALNNLDMPEDFSEEAHAEARLMHKVLLAYLGTKYK
jgi:hypothetical protein